MPRLIALILVLALRIHREPSLEDTLTLLKDFEDAPQTATADDAEDGAGYLILHKKRTADEGDTCQQEGPPAVGAEVILRLDDDWMKNSDS